MQQMLSSAGQTGLREALNSRKCGLEIGYQIGRMFEPNRKAHQAVPHIHVEPLLGREALVGGGGRMGYKTFRIAQIVGNPDQAQRVQKTEGCRFAALDGQGNQA